MGRRARPCRDDLAGEIGSPRAFFWPETEASLFAGGPLTWYQVWTARRLYFINTPSGNPVEPPEAKEGELPLAAHVSNLPRAAVPAFRQGFWCIG